VTTATLLSRTDAAPAVDDLGFVMTSEHGLWRLLRVQATQLEILN
jgi:hypothetical protein